MLNTVRASRPGDGKAVAKLLASSMLTTAMIAATLFVPAASAQTAVNAPVRQSIDANGVDLFLGTMNVDAPALSAGSGAQGLAYYKMYRGVSRGDNLMASLTVIGSTVYISYLGKTDRFTVSGSTYTPTEGNGSTLSLSGSVYTYTMADGTVALFNNTYVGGYPYGNYTGIVTSITRPGGDVTTFTYDSAPYCAASKPGANGDICTQRRTAYRIGNITNGSRFRLNFIYGNWDGLFPDPDTVPSGGDWQGWGDITGVSMVNSAIGGSSSRDQSWGTSGSYYNVTDAMGRVTGYRSGAAGLAGIKRPGSTGEDVTITYDGSNRVFTVTNAVGTTTYTYSDGGGLRTTTVTDPLGHPTVYVFDIASQRMKSAKDPLLRTTLWDYDASGRVTKVTAPELNYTQYTYDARGNVTETREVAKTGPGAGDIVTTAGYDASCTSPAKCNQPNWTKDARNNQTDFTYNTTTGTLTSVAAPAATVGGIRPTTTYSYTAVNGAQFVSSVSACRTTASCVGTADEVKTSIGYNGNGLPTTLTNGAGDGSLTATTTLGYDDFGDVLTVDGPLAGTADTTRYRYNADRELVGVTSPDPDGAGSLVPRAQKLTRDDKGRVTLAETGFVNSQSDADWAGFSTMQQVATTYDGVDHKTKEVLTAGGTTFAVTQYSYDGDGRLDCTAVRMNSATWLSQPDACTQTTWGAAGPDRITRNSYSVADQVTKVQTAYGVTGQVSDEVTSTYSTNGKLATATDAEGNTTTYEYDGFDRLSKTRYPGPTKGSGVSSTTDYEQLGYDAASNVTSRRLRDGQTITYGYDNLNQVTSKATPGSAYLDWDIAYSYDLLGRLTNATGNGSAVNGFAYDALGRLTTEQYYSATTYHAYDLAGRQTRLTWSDGFYVDYDYYVTGEVTAIRENGATSGAGVLATYTYDYQGRRTGVTRGNGTTTSYGYDWISRLDSLSQNLGGTSYDFTNSFTYNPASQIASLTHSNDVYAWNGHYNVDRSYGTNGLNQLTTAGPTSLGYDGRGNLTSSGSSSYSYTTENRMASVPGMNIAYEPGGGQLMQMVSTVTGGDARFAWSGGQMIAEIDVPWTIARRYVPGPGTDEPIVWYEGSGTSDRRWLHADERGSVVAVTDSSGNVVSNGINRYDEYGIPASTNIGRFQYTGQAWLPELGMYYYKARIYSPTLGRFMQTDPIGYGDGMNMYGYVGADPVNFVDPTGTAFKNPDIVVKGCGGVPCLFGDAAIRFLDALREAQDLWAATNVTDDEGIVVRGQVKSKPAPPKLPPVKAGPLPSSYVVITPPQCVILSLCASERNLARGRKVPVDAPGRICSGAVSGSQVAKDATKSSVTSFLGWGAKVLLGALMGVEGGPPGMATGATIAIGGGAAAGAGGSVVSQACL